MFCPGGEIGRHKGLKIPRYLVPCRFKSGPGHQLHFLLYFQYYQMGIKPTPKDENLADIDPRFLRDLKGIMLIALNLIIVASLISFSPDKSNWIGSFGFFLAKILYEFFGYAAWWIPVLIAIIIYDIFKGLLTPSLLKFSIIFSGWTAIFISSCGFFQYSFDKGGATGRIAYNFLPKLFGTIGFFLILLFIFIFGLLAATPFSLSHLPQIITFFKNLKIPKKKTNEYPYPEDLNFSEPGFLKSEPILKKEKNESSPRIIEPQKPIKPDQKPEKSMDDFKLDGIAGDIIMPDLDLLTDAPEETKLIDKDFFIKNSRTLEQKLLDFGVAGNVVEICPGPVVTMYEFSPAPGVKINKIASLSDDISLALGALSVRIIAPIPGKSVVGIEISNDTREIVYLKEILTSDTYTKFKGILPLSLGKDIVGQPVVVDLAKMPHLLIAGATGTGKSVGLNAMICSILYRLSPKNLRFLMIDPKRIELSPYDNIPHLIHPVISDSKIATKALLWLVNEMEIRYGKLDEAGARNLESYNKITGESMPYLVVVIDELADLMMVSSKDVESSIMRLAQKARAAGIHLIVATQRPSVDVITGLIKANFPSRISFKVSSKVDSRTILDVMGADRLLGMGDMLYLAPGTSFLKRVHGAFVSDKEVSQIANFLRNQAKPEYDLNIKDTPLEEDSDFEDISSTGDIDEKYDEAIEIVTSTGQTSISFLQRKLKVGYNRSARMIEQMEKDGILSQPDHTGKRKVLVNSYE